MLTFSAQPIWEIQGRIVLKIKLRHFIRLEKKHTYMITLGYMILEQDLSSTIDN